MSCERPMFDCNLKFKGTIENWDEGLPLGNGEIGSLVYGKANLIFALDRCDLWDLTPAPKPKSLGSIIKIWSLS